MDDICSNLVIAMARNGYTRLILRIFLGCLNCLLGFDNQIDQILHVCRLHTVLMLFFDEENKHSDQYSVELLLFVEQCDRSARIKDQCHSDLNMPHVDTWCIGISVILILICHM